MTERTLLSEAHRGEYYHQLIDRRERAALARRHQNALRLAGVWQPPTRILDVGCGSGLLLSTLSPPSAVRVGCDIFVDAFRDGGLRPDDVLFVQADGTRLPFADGSFDLVICLAVIGEFPDWRAALAEMTRAVAPGGVLYVTLANSRLLLPSYRLVERFGGRVRQTWWEYARACQRLSTDRASAGFGVPALAGWRYVDVTPYLARSHWSWVRVVPLSLLRAALSRLAPSFGFAWQRPRTS
ncbi:MAG TPA: methyltransferase domain-containing protein [Candidatus Acidoferrales bacterium]|nr:methyltransferase domain-containing protein [Candidatus Acidoferrales bacterium]